jgi:hypothetical protein
MPAVAWDQPSGPGWLIPILLKRLSCGIYLRGHVFAMGSASRKRSASKKTFSADFHRIHSLSSGRKKGRRSRTNSRDSA